MEVWGPHARDDLLTGFFIQRFAKKNLIDIEPIKHKLTWRNNRSGDNRVAKRLDRFLVSEQVVDRFFQLRQWVGSGGGYDHFPIFFDLQNGPHKPPGPLNFNKGWLKDESFSNFVSSLWVPYTPRGPLSVAF